MDDQTVPSVLADVSQQQRTNFMGFASFTLLVWDHVITFADEVEFIWKGKRSAMLYLFLINRYLTPLGFMVNLFAYLSPVWTPDLCSRFIRFEGSMTVIGISIVAVMMFLRVKALYFAQRLVVWGVATLWLLQTAVQAYLLTRGEAVVHNRASGVRACTMIFDPDISVLASSSAWLPLLYDTIIFGLTLYRTFPSIRHRNASYVMKRFLEDGLVYYSTILAVTLVLTVMIVSAPPGLKNITAQLELLLTVTMMSRMTLNLKKSVKKILLDDKVRPDLPSIFSHRSHLSIAPSIHFRPGPYLDSKSGPRLLGSGGLSASSSDVSNSGSSHNVLGSIGSVNEGHQRSRRLTTIGPITVVDGSRKMKQKGVEMEDLDERDLLEVWPSK